MTRPLIAQFEAALASRKLTPDAEKHARNFVSAYLGHVSRAANLESRLAEFLKDGRKVLKLEPYE